MDSAASDGLRVESRKAVRIVTIDRPAAKNAVDEQVHHALARVFDELSDDAEVRAIVLTGAGDTFSAGGDLDWLIRVQDDPVARLASLNEGQRIVRSIVGSRVPIVAAVNGPAVGLGCTLAVACDLVYMAERAFLSDPHVAIGLTAGDGGAALWPLTTSIVKAKEHLFFGTRVTSHEAVALGLANSVVPDAEILAHAIEVAERLAGLPPLAVQTTKRAIGIHQLRSMSGVLEYALAAEYQTFDTAEHRSLVRDRHT